MPAAKSPEVAFSGPNETAERLTGYQNSSPSDDQCANCGDTVSKSVISPYVEFVANVRSPFAVRYDVPLTTPLEKPFTESADQTVPLSSAGTHLGSTEKCDEEMVELVGIWKPSYVELEGCIPASSGVKLGPCQLAISAEAHGESNIRITRVNACLMLFTACNSIL